MKYIAVLLTVFNRKEKTLICLDNLFSQAIPEGYQLNFYLTNDGCTDGTPEAIRAKFPLVKIIDGDGTLYWNRGMWTAWNRATRDRNYDYYLWLNDDTTLFDGAIASLLAASEENGNKAIMIGATVDTKTKKKITYGGRVGYCIAPLDGQSHEVECFNGNIVLVPSIVYCLLGNLDYYYTHSKGDYDYGIRARKVGVKMMQLGVALGECDLHPRIDKWCDPKVPFSERWQLMKRPNGMPPHETFHLEKQINPFMAIFHYFTIYFRCLFPAIWIKIGKATYAPGQ